MTKLFLLGRTLKTKGNANEKNRLFVLLKLFLFLSAKHEWTRLDFESSLVYSPLFTEITFAWFLKFLGLFFFFFFNLKDWRNFLFASRVDSVFSIFPSKFSTFDLWARFQFLPGLSATFSGCPLWYLLDDYLILFFLFIGSC